MPSELARCVAAASLVILCVVLIYLFRRDGLRPPRPSLLNPVVNDYDNLTEYDRQVMGRQFVALIGCLITVALLFLTEQSLLLLGISAFLGYAGWSAISNQVNILGMKIVFWHYNKGCSAVLMGLVELVIAVALFVFLAQRWL